VIGSIDDVSPRTRAVYEAVKSLGRCRYEDILAAIDKKHDVRSVNQLILLLHCLKQKKALRRLVVEGITFHEVIL
jgi:hypothetical protein